MVQAIDTEVLGDESRNSQGLGPEEGDFTLSGEAGSEEEQELLG